MERPKAPKLICSDKHVREYDESFRQEDIGVERGYVVLYFCIFFRICGVRLAFKPRPRVQLLSLLYPPPFLSPGRKDRCGATVAAGRGEGEGPSWINLTQLVTCLNYQSFRLKFAKCDSASWHEENPNRTMHSAFEIIDNRTSVAKSPAISWRYSSCHYTVARNWHCSCAIVLCCRKWIIPAGNTTGQPAAAAAAAAAAFVQYSLCTLA